MRKAINLFCASMWPILLYAIAMPTSSAQEMPADYQQVLKATGKSGDYKANVLKVTFPATTCT